MSEPVEEGKGKKQKGGGRKHRIGRRRASGIQVTIMIAFTFVTIILMFTISMILYTRFSMSNRETTIQNTRSVIEQTRLSLEDHLVSMRQIADALYYNVITETDVSDPMLGHEMSLIYESYRDRLISVALYNETGSLIAAAPVANQKADPNVSRQKWFMSAMDEIENIHFSTPHVQNLFDDASYSYHWVISLSRAVDITDGDSPKMGVLLVDMNYSAVSQMLEEINRSENGQYYYLCDSSGEIIYHPKMVLIGEERAAEDTARVAGLTDGVYVDRADGEKRELVVSTISYTGWKLVGVIPQSAFSYGTINVQYFIILLFLLMVMMLLAVNRVVAGRISAPILALDNSVKAYEAGEKPQIVGTGPTEIRHLGHSIQKSYEQIDALMKQIVEEQNERRKSEFDALQSQINPHFLYNTLDSITWMVEGGKNDGAVYMISELAKLLRISLSKGHTIISVEDEIRHGRSYMNIQKIRYKDRFAVEYDIDPAVLPYSCVKLVIQPILENAIYYGVGDMDEDDGGKILVTGRLSGGDILISIEDNGPGMRAEEAANVLTGESKVHKHGSGVGLVNVHTRIRLIFGKEYGLHVESEPDCGTKVTIRIPAVPFNEENRRRLEQGQVPGKEGDQDEK